MAQNVVNNITKISKNRSKEVQYNLHFFQRKIKSIEMFFNVFCDVPSSIQPHHRGSDRGVINCLVIVKIICFSLL